MLWCIFYYTSELVGHAYWNAMIMFKDTGFALCGIYFTSALAQVGFEMTILYTFGRTGDIRGRSFFPI